MFEVVFTAFLAIGHLLARLGQAPLLRHVHLRACVIVAATLATALAPELYTAKDVWVLPCWLAQQREHDAATINAAQVIASQPVPALCSTPALCYWAGRSSEVDPFNFGEAVLTRQQPVTAVTDRIDAGYYGSIELNDAWHDLALPANSPGDISPAILAAVARS
jgi:hypothetical protein